MGSLVLLLDLPSSTYPYSMIHPSWTPNKGSCISCIIGPVASNNTAKEKEKFQFKE